MSEESVHINGIVQVAKFMIFGVVYITILYVIASATQGQFLDNATMTSLTNAFKSKLTEHGDNAKILLISGIIFLSLITGTLLYDLTKKFSIISIFLLLVVTAIDFVPVKIILDGSI